MSSFAHAMGALAELRDARLEDPWHWRDGGEPLQLRDGLYRALEEEQAAWVEASGDSVRPETAAILGIADRALGDLCGLIVGMADSAIDAEPSPGEWTIRQTLHHVLEVELSYRAGCGYALTRDEGEPVRMPAARRPQAADVDSSGSIAEVIARIADSRRTTDVLLIGLTDPSTSGLGDDGMTRPTVWAGYETDVRFRLHRFASHLVEHTVQCEKALRSMGAEPGEARQIVRAIWSARCAHEARSPEDRLRQLDQGISTLLAAAGAA